jgi:hypothetical protein
MTDRVQEFITKRNREAAAEPNPLIPKRPAPDPVPAELAGDPTAVFIRRRNAAAASQPNPLAPRGNGS